MTKTFKMFAKKIPILHPVYRWFKVLVIEATNFLKSKTPAGRNAWRQLGLDQNNFNIEISKYKNQDFYDFGGVKINFPVTADVAFNVLLPHVLNLHYKQVEI